MRLPSLSRTQWRKRQSVNQGKHGSRSDRPRLGSDIDPPIGTLNTGSLNFFRRTRGRRTDRGLTQQSAPSGNHQLGEEIMAAKRARGRLAGAQANPQQRPVYVAIVGALAAAGALVAAPAAEAVITGMSIDCSRSQSPTYCALPNNVPTFGGASFGAVGQYEKIRGTATGDAQPSGSTQRHNHGHRSCAGSRRSGRSTRWTSSSSSRSH